MLLKRKSVKVASLIVLSAVAIAIYIAPDLNSGWLLASKSYGDLGMPEYGGLARLLVYATSALMAMSILAWIPQQKLRRSEEHTSELQSRGHLVCRLLLEIKKGSIWRLKFLIKRKQ